MKRKFVILAWAIGASALPLLAIPQLVAISSSQASDCEQDLIQRVVDSGAYLLTVSGHYLRFLGQDFIDPRNWQPGERLLICPAVQAPSETKVENLYDVTNVQRGEKLVALRSQTAP